MTRASRHRFEVEAPAAGRRLDLFLAERLPGMSRARLQELIASGRVSVEPAGAAPRIRSSYRVRAGERVSVDIPPVEPATLRPEAIPLDIVYEDPDLLVVNKPPGLTVHPGAGRASGTLVHAVLAHCPDLPGVGGALRPGIVHRLDRDTSGLIIVAKTEAALRALQAQIQARRVRRDYLALVCGVVTQQDGTVDAPIGRDPRHRTRMAIVASGRPAVTHYRVVERFRETTLLEVRLETGRTHQIRVHCASIGHPVVGDPVYGRRANRWGIKRQALHAHRLSFVHPSSGRDLRLTAPPPADMQAVLEQLWAEPRAASRP